jgi:putative redox protein
MVTMTALVKWLEDSTFVGESSSGHSIVMSSNTDNSPSPMELVLLGLGGCSSIDVVSMLQKGKADIRSCIVKLDSERAETVPKVFTKIKATFVITGKGLKTSAVERAVSLSAEKYCSVSIMLGKAVEITHDYEIIAVE